MSNENINHEIVINDNITMNIGIPKQLTVLELLGLTKQVELLMKAATKDIIPTEQKTVINKRSGIHHWTEEEDDAVKMNYYKMTPEKMSKNIDILKEIPKSKIEGRITYFNLTKKKSLKYAKSKGKTNIEIKKSLKSPFSNKELKLVREKVYAKIKPSIAIVELCDVFGKPYQQVKDKFYYEKYKFERGN